MLDMDESGSIRMAQSSEENPNVLALQVASEEEQQGCELVVEKQDAEEERDLSNVMEKSLSAPKKSKRKKKLSDNSEPSSVKEDIEFGVTENAWKPSRLKPRNASEEENIIEALYKNVRRGFNKWMPHKLDVLINQLRALQIDSHERLQVVIDLVFERTVHEPSYSVGCALMCKELAMMQVSGPDSEAGKEESNVNFRKLIITRCQTEFEKNTVDKSARAIKMKEIEACADPGKKKELRLAWMEQERRMRMKSVGNIRFIGELFKQGMLTTNIMHRCIHHLLTQIDEESLECLCELLGTIGEDLESKYQPLDTYFNQVRDIVSGKVPGKFGWRVRFMLKDIIELRMNKWVPRRDIRNPETMDQILKEAETQRLDMHTNNTQVNTQKKNDRKSRRKRNRGVGPIEEGGLSQPVRNQEQHSVGTSKFKDKPNMFQWTRNVSADAPKTVTPKKFAMLENVSSEQDKLSTLQLSGSRSSGPRDYGRQDYKSSYDSRSSQNGSQQLGSRSSSRLAKKSANILKEYLSDTDIGTSTDHLTSSHKHVPQNISVKAGTPVKPNKLSTTHISSEQEKPSTHPISESTSRSTRDHADPSDEPSGASKPPIKKLRSLVREKNLAKKSATILENYLSDGIDIDTAAVKVRETFNDSTFSNFVRESLSKVVNKSSTDRKQVSHLMAHLISANILPCSLYLFSLTEVLDGTASVVIDFTRIWVHLAELIWYPLAEGIYQFSELKELMAPLKDKGLAGTLMGELMIVLIQEKGAGWIKDKWDRSGLELSDFLHENESLNDFVKKYKLEFLFREGSSNFASSSRQLTMPQIHDQLLCLMCSEEKNSLDNICSWISTNVGETVSDPEFIKVLMTTILEVSIERHNNTWQFKVDKFQNLQDLIPRYIDANIKLTDLRCLIAIQEHIHQLEHPQRILLEILEKQIFESILSFDVFRVWESNKDLTPLSGKSAAMLALKTFFTSLKETNDMSTREKI